MSNSKFNKRIQSNDQLTMNWTQPRKSYKSTEPQNTRNPNLTTPTKLVKKQQEPLVSSPILQEHRCSYHFNQLTHICLTCHKSICVRCILTYCKQHMTYQQKQIIPHLLGQLMELQVQPLKQQILLKLKQSDQRKQYIMRKFQKIQKKIQQNFQYVINTLTKKQTIIHQYYQEEQRKILQDYETYESILKDRMNYLKNINLNEMPSIQSLTSLEEELKKCLTGKQPLTNRIQKKINKIKIQKLWSEQKLERILYEIQHINYKINNNQSNNNLKKKRISTQTGWFINGGINNHFINVAKSTSHSKIQTGRKIQDHLEKT